MKLKSIIVLLIIVVISFLVHSASATLSTEFKDEIYNLFPTGNSFAGEQKNWLDSSIIEYSNDKYTELKKNYTYYSKYGQTIFDIKREPTFNVTVQLFIAHDYITADKIFDSLQKKIDYKYKKEINFGEQGYLFIKPLDVKNIKAQFYTVVKNQVFVIKITSNDGFALMDFTEYISTSIANFIYNHIELFALNRLRLKCTLNNKESLIKEIILLNKKIKDLILEGYVKDGHFNPIPEAKVNFIELGVSTVTDEKGHYIIKSSIGKTGQDLKFTKNFIFKLPQGEESDTIRNYFYKVTMYSEQNRANSNQFILKLNDTDDKTAEIFNLDRKSLEFASIITKDKKNITFIRDCSTGVFNCKQKLVGTFSNDGFIGSWEGFGGKGSFKANLVSNRESKDIYLSDSNCSIRTIIAKSDGTFFSPNNQNLTLYNLPDEKAYLYFTCSLNKNDLFFLDKANLVLYHMPSESHGEEILRTSFAKFDKDSNKLDIYSEIGVQKIKSTDEPHKINIDITRYLKNNLYNNQGMLISIKSTSTHFFAGLNSPHAIHPKITLHIFSYATKKNTHILKVNYCNREADFASNSNKPVSDGKNDICVEIKPIGINGKIDNIEFNYKGTVDFIWNSKTDDIYPNVALVENGKVKSHITLKSNQPIKAYLYKPELFDYNKKLYYSITINNKSYEGIVESTNAFMH